MHRGHGCNSCDVFLRSQRHTRSGGLGHRLISRSGLRGLISNHCKGDGANPHGLPWSALKLTPGTCQSQPIKSVLPDLWTNG